MNRDIDHNVPVVLVTLYFIIEIYFHDLKSDDQYVSWGMRFHKVTEIFRQTF